MNKPSLTALDEQLDSLLRGEISAIETYSQAIHQFPDEALKTDLHSLRDSHQQHVGILRRLIHEGQGDPPTSSGLWGTFAKAVEGTAAALSETLALKALKEGEEHGIKDYEEALNCELPPRVELVIRNEILPTLHGNVADLVRLIGT